MVAAKAIAAEARGPSGDPEVAGTQEPPAVEEPDLADMIPLASKLAGRLVTLENRIAGLLDVSDVESNYAKIKTNLQEPADQLRALEDSKDYKYSKLVELREIIKQEAELFERTSKPLSQAIRQLGDWRQEWLAERRRWNEWQSSLDKEGEFDQLKATFAKAQDSIDTALNLVLPQLGVLLTVQEKASDIQAEIHALAAELDSQLAEERRGTLLNTAPPMYSSEYFSQFRTGDLWYAIEKGGDGISWPDERFLARQGWILLIQGFITVFMIVTFYRNRRALSESERWRFLIARPLSAGLFLGFMATVMIYEYVGVPAVCKVINVTIAGIAGARLSKGLIEVSWKKQCVYALVICLVVTRLLDVLSFPLPLLRLCRVCVALCGILLCLWWARESRRHADSGLCVPLLRLGSLFLAVVIIAEIWGKEALAAYLFIASVRSMTTVLVFMLFLYIIRGGLEWLFRVSPLRRAAVLHSGDTDAIIGRVARFIDLAICGVVLLPAILMIWGAYGSLEEATKGLSALGFNLGSQRITAGLILASAGILYGSFLASWVFEKLLMDEVLLRREMQRGIRHSVARLAHYIIVFAGFLVALGILGFDFTKLTIVLSAFGVGIGFGLQGVVNNFVSGLILLFEGPVRVGDIVEIQGNWAEIRRIGLRATTIKTYDEADVILPNSDLIANQVTNWTLSNRRVRLIIPVGVAYGSDIPLAMETLIACTSVSSKVAKWPAPQVLFLSFGESSLDLELRVWISDADHRLTVRSELHQEINRRFREANIEIAFPQQDLHLRSVDDAVVLRSSEAAK
jgi:small-conductance mechanosensitive channel